MSSHITSAKSSAIESLNIINALVFLILFVPGIAAALPGIQEVKNGPASKKIAIELEYVDLVVSSFGDDLTFSREFIDGKWVWNRAWLPIKSMYAAPSSSGSSKGGVGLVQPDPSPWYLSHNTVIRYKATFDIRSGSTVPRAFRAAGEALGEFIELSDNGMVWRDIHGNWIRYLPRNPDQVDLYGGEPQIGDIHSYGNALYQNSFELDSKYRISGIRDTFGNLLLTIQYDGESDRPVLVEDYSGRSVRYRYNTDNQLIEVTDVRGKLWSYTYTNDGEVSSLKDPNGNITSYQYSQNALTIVNADQLETKFQYEYDKAAGTFKRVEVRPDGSIREAIFDNTEDTPTTTPEYEFRIDGNSITRRYGSGTFIRIVDTNGEETTYERDQYQQTTKATHPDGTTEQWIYSADSRYLKAYVDRKGIRTEWEYDDKGRVTEIRQAVGLPEQKTVRYSYPDLKTRIVTTSGDQYTADLTITEKYDEYGNRVSLTDGAGNTTNYTYDVLGNIQSEKTPNGGEYLYEYDPAGNLLKQTDPLGRISSYAYDGFGNLITETLPNGAVTIYSYNALNQQVGTTNARNETVETIYDRASRTFTLKDARGAKTQVRLNSLGLPELIEDPNGNQTKQTYDNGRLISTQHPTFEQTYEYASGSRLKGITEHYDGKQSSTALKVDPLGQVTELIDANNNPEQRQYDAFGRLTQITDALGGITRLTYDVHGNLVKVTDPEGRETRFEYNANGQVTAEERQPTPSQVSRRSYQYDANGNLATEITPNGEKAVYSYNDADELVKIELFDKVDSVTPKQTIILTYNSMGQLTSYDDGETKGSYEYDELGQLITASTDYGPFVKSISYTYDAAGNIATYTNPEGVTYTYNYDDSGLIRSINIPGTGTIAFSEYQWTQPTRITLPGGSIIERQYDGLERMASNTLLDPAQNALMKVLYGYDPVGNILSQSTQHGDYTYGYDNLYRLTQADYPAANDETFEYDGVGNRTGYNGDRSWTYNDANQLTQQGDTSYEYDANGNLIKKTVSGQVTHFIYNSQERLVQVESHNRQVVARYGYNPLGLRLWKEVSGERTYFFYNHSGLVGEYSSTGALIKEYQYTPDSTWMTNPLFQRDQGNVYFYQNDHLGAPQRAVATSGGVVWKANYTAFGEAAPSITTVSNNLRFPGQYLDSETSLHHNYFRDYDYDLGRYIQADPWGLLDGPNVYLYVYANPLGYYDPTGEFAFVGAGIGIVSGAATAFLLGCDYSLSDALRDGAIGFVTGGLGSTLQKAGNIRKAYKNGLAAARKQNLTPRGAHQVRRELGKELKEQSPFKNLIYKRNRDRYDGDPLGPPFDPNKHFDVEKTLTDTNPYLDPLTKLPPRGLGASGAAAGGAGSAALCGC